MRDSALVPSRFHSDGIATRSAGIRFFFRELSRFVNSLEKYTLQSPLHLIWDCFVLVNSGEGKKNSLLEPPFAASTRLLLVPGQETRDELAQRRPHLDHLVRIAPNSLQRFLVHLAKVLRVTFLGRLQRREERRAGVAGLLGSRRREEERLCVGEVDGERGLPARSAGRKGQREPTFGQVRLERCEASREPQSGRLARQVGG